MIAKGDVLVAVTAESNGCKLVLMHSEIFILYSSALLRKSAKKYTVMAEKVGYLHITSPIKQRIIGICSEVLECHNVTVYG